MKIGKIIVTVLLVVIILTSAVSVVFAEIDPNAYKPSPVGTENKLMDIVKPIVGAINMIATIIFVVAIIILGIKYMTASVEERANYKKTMLPILIGGLLIFGTTTILNLILNAMPQEIAIRTYC